MTNQTKPTFQEWIKENPPKCKCCTRVLPWGFEHYGKELNKITDIGGERVKGFYCSDCHEYAQANLMNERFVETYKGNTIYFKDGRYHPYWESFYYLKTLEECRIRIDAKHIAVMPWGIVNLEEETKCQ